MPHMNNSLLACRNFRNIEYRNLVYNVHGRSVEYNWIVLLIRNFVFTVLDLIKSLPTSNFGRMFSVAQYEKFPSDC